MSLRYTTGRLLYLKRSTGAVRGREDFSITENRDGTATLTALAITDDSKFVRHVVYTKARDGRPRDVFVRLQVNGDLVGTGYFRLEGDTLHITTDTAMTGHTVQAVKAPADFFSVVTHSVMLDGWITLNYDWEVGGLQRRMGEVQRAERERARELEAQNLRLRAELVVLRTGVLWGLGTGAVVRRARPPARDNHAFDPVLRAAQAVICQTGCVGHAHPWLEADGQCRRSGQACERPVDEAHALGASDPAPR